MSLTTSNATTIRAEIMSVVLIQALFYFFSVFFGMLVYGYGTREAWTDAPFCVLLSGLSLLLLFWFLILYSSSSFFDRLLCYWMDGRIKCVVRGSE